jgi:hypothetical protein
MRSVPLRLILLALLVGGCGSPKGSSVPDDSVADTPGPEAVAAPDLQQVDAVRGEDSLGLTDLVHSTDTPGTEVVGLDGGDGGQPQDADTLPAGPPGRPWNEGPYGTGIMDVAADFVLPTTQGEWQFAAQWTGKDSYVFVFRTLSFSGLNKTVWNSSIKDLLASSPENVHYFFGSYRPDWQEDIAELGTRLSDALGELSEEKKAHWSGRVHLINASAAELEGGVGDFIGGGYPYWFAVDRFQRWREVGNLLDWKAYFEGQPSATHYPMRFLANEAAYFEYESALQDSIEALGATEVVLWDGDDSHPGGWGGGYSSKWSVELPEAEVIAGFDSLALHLYTACPGHLQGKENGCNEWDYIQQVFLCDTTVGEGDEPLPDPVGCEPKTPAVPPVMGACTKSGASCETTEQCGEDGICEGYVPGVPEVPAETAACECRRPWGEVVDSVRICADDGASFGPCQCGCETEFARQVTAYAREGAWLTDLSPFLAFLRDGVKRTFRFAGANGYLLTGSLLFYNAGKGHRPQSIRYLWGKAGGESFNLDYNALHPEIAFEVPEGAQRVEIAALVSGHGHSSTLENCAEFCNHQHHFILNGAATFKKEHPTAGTWYGCMDQIGEGVTPNQFGTWIFGRGGWCPGQDIKLWSADITQELVSGTNTLSYKGLFKGKEYSPTPNGQGDYMPEIKMTSWLVFYEEM